MEAARPVALEELPASNRIEVPPQLPRRPSTLQWIRYSVERDDFDRVAEDLGVDAPADVGRETFRFYLGTQLAD